MCFYSVVQGHTPGPASFYAVKNLETKLNASTQQFSYGCHALPRKIMCNPSKPLAQLIHRENAERMLFASFVSRLTGPPGKQFTYAIP